MPRSVGIFSNATAAAPATAAAGFANPAASANPNATNTANTTNPNADSNLAEASMALDLSLRTALAIAAEQLFSLTPHPIRAPILGLLPSPLVTRNTDNPLISSTVGCTSTTTGTTIAAASLRSPAPIHTAANTANSGTIGTVTGSVASTTAETHVAPNRNS